MEGDKAEAEHERASHTPSPHHPIPLTASRKTTAKMDVTNSTLPEDPRMPLQANVALSTALGINLLLSLLAAFLQMASKKLVTGQM